MRDERKIHPSAFILHPFMVVYYLHGDHLGSTSLTTDASGQKVSASRYLPYGEIRWGDTGPTDFGFTGQRNDSYIKLIQMGARWYDGQLGRFISPDTIIPDPVNPQNFNRYAYGLGNPIKYRDPSGHDVDCGIGESDCRQRVAAEKEENQSVVPEFIDNAKEFIDDNINPWVVIPSGLGWRFDGSAVFGGGPDVNIDIVGLWSSGEFDVLGNGNLQGGYLGQVGASTGLLIYFNVDEMKTLAEGMSIFGGGSVPGVTGGEVEVSYSQNPDGSPSLTVYGGVGPESPSVGVPIYGGVGKTYVTASGTIDQARHLYTKTEEAIWDYTTQGYYGSYPRR